MRKIQDKLQFLGVFCAIVASTAFGEMVTNVVRSVSHGEHFPRSPKYKVENYTMKATVSDENGNVVSIKDSKVTETRTEKLFPVDGKVERSQESWFDPETGTMYMQGKAVKVTSVKFCKPSFRPLITKNATNTTLGYQGSIENAPGSEYIQIANGTLTNNVVSSFVSKSGAKTYIYEEKSVNEETKTSHHRKGYLKVKDKNGMQKIKVKDLDFNADQAGYPQTANVSFTKSTLTVQQGSEDQVNVVLRSKENNREVTENLCRNLPSTLNRFMKRYTKKVDMAWQLDFPSSDVPYAPGRHDHKAVQKVSQHEVHVPSEQNTHN